MRRILIMTLMLSGLLLARTHPDYRPLIRSAEAQASPAARKILHTARSMVARGIIVRGSCWDYLNTVFRRAGYPASKRQIVFRQSKSGPYAPASNIRAGDWLYYINHSYGGIEHSGLFVAWVNRRRWQGLILSYGGEHRKQPGRYRVYDLRNVYHISRAP